MSTTQADARNCGNTNCHKPLEPPFLQCARCQQSVYCSKVCQTTAWKAGHKRECVPAAALIAPGRASKKALEEAMKTPESGVILLPPKQLRLWHKMKELEAKSEWKRMMVLEGEVRTLAREVRHKEKVAARFYYDVFGNCCKHLGQHAKAIEFFDEARALAEEMDLKKSVGVACNDLGDCYRALGQMEKAMGLYEEAKAIAEEVQDYVGIGRVQTDLGYCYQRMGLYKKALGPHIEARAAWKKGGPLCRAAVSTACTNVGICYRMLGEYNKAIELQLEARAIAEEAESKSCVWKAITNLASCYQNQNMYHKAIALGEESKAIAEEVGNMEGVGIANINMGNCYTSLGHHEKALECLLEGQRISKELGERKTLGTVCTNLGICYRSMGQFNKAIALYEEGCAIAEEVGDEESVGRACTQLATIYSCLGEHDKAVAYAKQKHQIFSKLELSPEMGRASLAVGIAMRLRVRGKLFSSGALPVAGMHDRQLQKDAGGGEVSKDEIMEARVWLQTALLTRWYQAYQHLANLALDAGEEEEAVNELKSYLDSCVKQGRLRCLGCEQMRGGDESACAVGMLTCSGCRIARFCDEDHQKLASNRRHLGLLRERHKDICALLNTWRQVQKGQVDAEACYDDIVAYLYAQRDYEVNEFASNQNKRERDGREESREAPDYD